MIELLINGALHADGAQVRHGTCSGMGTTAVITGWKLYNADPEAETRWIQTDGGGPPSSPAHMRIEATKPGTRLYQPLPVAAAGPVQIQGWIRVVAGSVLAGAGTGAMTVSDIELIGRDWNQFAFCAAGPIDQVVFYSAAPNTIVELAAVTAHIVLTPTPATALDTRELAVARRPVEPGTRSASIAPSKFIPLTGSSTTMTAPASNGAATPLTQTPPALVSFDAGGTASVISYQVPEPTSYQGKHVLTLTNPLSDFADVVPPTPNAPSPATAVTPTTSSLADKVAVPASVVLSDSTTPGTKVVAFAPFDLSDRLAALTWADVSTAAGSSKRVELFRSVGGQLDYRVRRTAPRGSAAGPRTATEAAGLSFPKTGLASAAALSPTLIAAPTFRARNGGGDGGVGGVGRGGGGYVNPYVAVEIGSPDAGNPSISGPWNGLALQVSGYVQSRNAGAVSATVTLVNASGATERVALATIEADSTWHSTLPVTSSGTYTVHAYATAGTLNSHAAVTITVTLADPPAVTPPPTPPSPTPALAVTAPTRNAVFVNPTGNSIAEVIGSVDTGGGTPVSVTVAVDGGPGTAVSLTAAGGTQFTFHTSTAIIGAGMHTITLTAVNQAGVPAPTITIPVRLSPTQPILAIDRRLLLIEKIAVTSFLANFGASRVVKTVSLLPGEQTTITVDTYTKSEATTKSASSILDSTASDCAADFEDTINSENDTKASTQDATTLSISADIGASWGWGHADIKAGYTAQANASRENTTKTVQNAIAKHSSKASSNRTVNVNTEFSQTTSTGTTTDTTRTLKNINMSRVLNFVFRQLTQQHQVIVHLIDATLGYYTQDVLLDGAGKPQIGADGNEVTRETFTEYTLPEIGAFAATEMTGVAMNTLSEELLNVLSSIPDHTGNQQSLVEMVTPTAAAGTPQPDAAYLRVKPGLSQTYQMPDGGPQLTVPGIILGTTTCVMRTDQLLCDALLGEGDALDSYSHGLQDVALAERQMAVEERGATVARERLAQQIISTNDATMAATWQKIFPQPLSVPATVTVPAARISNGATAATVAG